MTIWNISSTPPKRDAAPVGFLTLYCEGNGAKDEPETFNWCVVIRPEHAFTEHALAAGSDRERWRAKQQARLAALHLLAKAALALGEVQAAKLLQAGEGWS
jgi:hypothetical protein